jgi:hypothetical protein
MMELHNYLNHNIHDPRMLTVIKNNVKIKKLL